jgi:hypothetical protein
MESIMRLWRLVFTLLLGAFCCAPASAGSIFLTGHDPDFHAFVGGNAAGAAHINQVAIGFVQDPAFNPFFAGGVHKFLFVESTISPPAGHVNGVNGIIASGYVNGVNFDLADASTLNSALNKLGTTYSAIVVASDFGGVLTQSELDILNARRNSIIGFLNQGGGLYAMAEIGPPLGLTTSGQFGYLPIVASSAAKNQSEVGNTLTPFGMSLGLLTSDINGNFSHNIFTTTGGLNVVDMDSSGEILSLAGRQQVFIPEPASVALLGVGGVCLLGCVRRRRRA